MIKLTPQQIRLQKIGEELKKTKQGTPKWKRLMAELDKICGTEVKPRNKKAEAAWEKSKN